MTEQNVNTLAFMVLQRAAVTEGLVVRRIPSASAVRQPCDACGHIGIYYLVVTDDVGPHVYVFCSACIDHRLLPPSTMMVETVVDRLQRMERELSLAG